MLGNAGQKISRMVELAETLYEKVIQLREEVEALRKTAQETRDRIADLEEEVANQRALLEAVADAHDLDVEAIREAAGDDEPSELDEAAEPAEAASGTAPER